MFYIPRFVYTDFDPLQLEDEEIFWRNLHKVYSNKRKRKQIFLEDIDLINI